MVHQQVWLDDETVDEEWSFTWTPPGSGAYTVQPMLFDWADYLARFITEAPPVPASGPPAAPGAEPPQAPAPVMELPEGIELAVEAYFPLIFGREGRSAVRQADGFYRTYLPFIATEIDDLDEVAIPGYVIYVDLEPPSVTIDPTLLTADHRRGRNGLFLSGSAGDDAKLHRVEVRINDESWQQVTLGEEGEWRHIWVFDPPLNGESIDLTVRATDIAGRTTTVTESLFVDMVTPESGSASIFYIDESGQRQPAPESAAPVATSTVGVTWDALEGQGNITYNVGFSRQRVIDEDDLTSYESAGEQTQAVQPGERWYATVRYVDEVGNASTAVLGPVTISAGNSTR